MGETCTPVTSKSTFPQQIYYPAPFSNDLRLIFFLSIIVKFELKQFEKHTEITPCELPCEITPYFLPRVRAAKSP